MLNIDELIKAAMKEKSPSLSVLRMIKAKKQELITAKNAKPYTEDVEISMLKKMAEEYEQDAEMYRNAGNSVEGDKYAKDAELIRSFLPVVASDDEIREYAKTVVVPGDKKNMGNYIKQIKNNFPGSDGKTVSGIVSSLIN